MTKEITRKPDNKDLHKLEELIDNFAGIVTSSYGQITGLARKIKAEAESMKVDDIHLRDLLLSGMRKHGVKEGTASNIVAGFGLKNLLYKPQNLKVLPKVPPVESSRPAKISPVTSTHAGYESDTEEVPEYSGTVRSVEVATTERVIDVDVDFRKWESEIRMGMMNRIMRLRIDTQRKEIVDIS